MADRPTGTVTFLFTDVEGSTRLWEQDPAAMHVALARHDALIEACVAQQGGTLVRPRGEGDSRFAVFTRATDAVVAAATLQRALHAEPWPTPTPLRVRLALHTGEADLREGDYYGSAVNRCARLRAAAHGGQTLLSQVTAALVQDALPLGVALRDLGIHRLKDLQRPEHIFQLVSPDVPADFPPLRTLDVHPTNLPIQPTPLIGREHEGAAACALLRHAEVRLLTLTGPGGVGKTRLALQIAAELLEAFADGVYFVDLSPIRDAALVVPTIAQTLGLTERGAQPIAEQLTGYLRDKQLLLLLDNCEQVLEAAPAIAELLAAAPQLKVLSTSRAALHLRGEHEFSVPPLAVPDPQHLPDLTALTQYAAVQLFIERAQAVTPRFELTEATARAIAELCVRLDGLPLAIELAAARSKLLSPQALLARLHHRLPVLTGGARDLPARQQTLRHTIDWSYRLLAPAEQTLFWRLAVFIGGWTLEAAEAVCNVTGDLEMDVLDGLAVLVDHSLLRQQGGWDGEPRFVMLETIREYALERLEESGEAETLRRHHAAYYLLLAEQAESKFTSMDWDAAQEWQARLAVEYDNLRAALAWSQVAADGATFMRLAAALWPFWFCSQYTSEGRAWVEAALQQDAGGRPTPCLPWHSSVQRVRAKLLFGAGELARAQGDFETARARLEVSVVLWREGGDQPGLAQALNSLGLVAEWGRGDYATAHTLQTESVAVFRALGDQHGLAFALDCLAGATLGLGDTVGARALFEESLALCRELRNKPDLVWPLCGLATVALQQGDSAAAQAWYEEALALARELGDTGRITFILPELGKAVAEQGNYEWATALLEECLGLCRELQHRWGSAGALYTLGEVAQAQGDYDRAVARYQESMMLYRELGDKRRYAMALGCLGDVAVQQGSYSQAAALLEESLALFRELGDQHGMVSILEGCARLAVAQGQAERATRLFGATAVLREARHMPTPPAQHIVYERNLPAACTQLDEATFVAAWGEGQAMSVDQIIADAFARREPA